MSFSYTTPCGASVAEAHEFTSHAKGVESNGLVAVSTVRVTASDVSNVNTTAIDDPHLRHPAPTMCVVFGLSSNRPSKCKVLLKLFVYVLP